MKVRLDFSKDPDRKPVFLNMELLPRVGEFLVSERHGTCEVLNVLHTPDAYEQKAVLVLGKANQ